MLGILSDLISIQILFSLVSQVKTTNAFLSWVFELIFYGTSLSLFNIWKKTEENFGDKRWKRINKGLRLKQKNADASKDSKNLESNLMSCAFSYMGNLIKITF